MYYDRSDAWHARARAVIESEQRGLILPAPVIPEIDHLLGHRLGAKSRLTFYAGLAEGYYLVVDLPREGTRVADLNRRYDELGLGFVDAAVIAISEAVGVRRIATTDRRHFDPLAVALSLQLVPDEPDPVEARPASRHVSPSGPRGSRPHVSPHARRKRGHRRRASARGRARIMRRMLRSHASFIWWLVLAASAAACQSAGPDPVATPRTAIEAAPREPEAIRWVRDSSEYVAAALQTYQAATSRVEQEGPRWPAGRWVVILDADETVISSLQYQIERARARLAYTPESWAAWVRRREAVPIPGAAKFLERVRVLGGRIAIVTNRLGSECDDAIAVFRAHALAYDAMLCRPDGSPSDKTARFESVAAGRILAGSEPLTVVAVVGDNILDFPGLTQAARASGAPALADFGIRYFILPNPMYGSWQ